MSTHAFIQQYVIFNGTLRYKYGRNGYYDRQTHHTLHRYAEIHTCRYSHSCLELGDHISCMAVTNLLSDCWHTCSTLSMHETGLHSSSSSDSVNNFHHRRRHGQMDPELTDHGDNRLLGAWFGGLCRGNEQDMSKLFTVFSLSSRESRCVRDSRCPSIDAVIATLYGSKTSHSPTRGNNISIGAATNKWHEEGRLPMHFFH